MQLGEKKHWHKSTLWQRSTHVTMIIGGPGVREPGKDCSQPVIRYADGSEELYDSVNDPNEFHNLPALPKCDTKWAPQTSAESKPDRTAFDFDFPSYTWKLKRKLDSGARQ